MICVAALIFAARLGAADVASMAFTATTPTEAEQWQQGARAKLFELMMGGSEPERVPLNPVVLKRETILGGRLQLEEIELQSQPNRKAHAWIARPTAAKGRLPAVLAIPGHGGAASNVVRGEGLYWYGRELAEMGCIVIAPDVSQHALQNTNWSLMGERTWDALRCLDYVAGLPEVDTNKLGVAGLSLGGETTMYVAALDTRLKVVCSSGWLTTVANMKNGHCACFDFPGLEENFDFSDIFSCIAPRALICELGEQERAPGGFPVEIGKTAFESILKAYAVLGRPDDARLAVHAGPHVFDGKLFFKELEEQFGVKPPQHQGSPLAWIRFTDGPEKLDGIPYHWLATAPLELVFETPVKAGNVFELSWGSKGDERQAVVTVNGREFPVTAGGHWGFRWVRVPLPNDLTGSAYKIRLDAAGQRAAFLSELRIVAAERTQAPDLNPSRYRATKIDKSPEAFPEMRAQWQMPSAAPRGLSPKRLVDFRKADTNGQLAAEAFYRSRTYVDGWLGYADPKTGLIPRNLRESRDFWNGRDSAADNYPYMVLTAAMTDPDLMRGKLLEMLRTETRLTSRVGRLPDDYSFSKQGWRREKLNLDEIIFDGAEYVKDGLLPITEWLGPSPWSERMQGILDDIWANAEIETPFGKVPTRNFEVAGDLLQACSRMYWFTGDKKYLEWGVRLGDFYLLGTNHPTRDLPQLRLVDHGCEVVNGLTELYVAVANRMPAKREQYRKPLHAMLDDILEKGRNTDGLFYTWFKPSGEHSKALCDTWGYDYDGFYTVWLLDREKGYREAVRKALSSLNGRYVGMCWEEQSADAYADSIEGAINLVNREDIPSAKAWIDSQTKLM